jgi:hypothetical protein
MQKRFWWVAFFIATLIHFAGTWALFADYFRAWAEWKRSGVDYYPMWLTVLWWIWVPIPLLIRRAFSLFASPFALDYYSGPSFLLWSLCIGFSLAFLCRAFSHGDAKASNRSMQRTPKAFASRRAGRCENHI